MAFVPSQFFMVRVRTPYHVCFYKEVRPVLLLHRIRWQFKLLPRRKYRKISGKMGKINDSCRQIPGTGNPHRENIKIVH